MAGGVRWRLSGAVSWVCEAAGKRHSHHMCGPHDRTAQPPSRAPDRHMAPEHSLASPGRPAPSCDVPGARSLNFTPLARHSVVPCRKALLSVSSWRELLCFLLASCGLGFMSPAERLLNSRWSVASDAAPAFLLCLCCRPGTTYCEHASSSHCISSVPSAKTTVMET